MITGASAEGMVMLVIEALDGATVECAGALVACEQAAARRVRPELPAAFDSPDVCTAALQRLCDSGQHGLVVMGNGRAAAVMAAAARENPAVGRYALLLAEGFAVDPDLADPTGVLAAAFADLAAPLIAGGVRRYYLLHTVLPRLSEALSNLGFGRRSAYGIQPAAPRRGSSAVAVRIAAAGDLETIARLALVEIQHRSAPPMFAPRQDRRLADLIAEQRPARGRRRPPSGHPRRARRRPAHHRADLTGPAAVPRWPALHRPHRHAARRARPRRRARARRHRAHMGP
jgi:hypothetical protein